MNKEETPQINTGNEDSRVTAGDKNQSLQVDENQLKGLVRDRVQEEVQKEIKFDKASLFTVFGIFAAIVTFISTEIQLLRMLCGFWSAVGFSIVILASLLTFILVLDYIGRGWRNDFKLEARQFPWILMIFIICLFVTGFVSASFSEKESTCREEAIFKKYESNFIDKQLELEREYDSKINNLQQEVREEVRNLRKQIQQNKQ